MNLSEKEKEALDQIVNNPKFSPTSISKKAAEYLHDSVVKHRPEIVVEIGCFIGYSTIHLTKAIQENGRGRLISFDKNTITAKKNIETAGLSEYVTFIDGYSEIEIQKFLNNNNINIDFAFIDGDHTKRGCLLDVEAIFPKISKNSILIFHDIYPEKCGWSGPRYIINIIEKHNKINGYAHFEVKELEDLDMFGVAKCSLTSLGKNPFGCSGIFGRFIEYFVKSKICWYIEGQIFLNREHVPHKFKLFEILFNKAFGTWPK